MRSQQPRQSGQFKPSMTSAEGSEKKLELVADVMHRGKCSGGKMIADICFTKPFLIYILK